MRVQQTKLQQSKTYVHIAQVVFIFVAGCLALAVLTKDGGTDGRVGWFFGLVGCLDTYMICRGELMAKVFPYNTGDSVPSNGSYVVKSLETGKRVCILWFSAFIALATWVNAGKSKGGKDQKKPASCDVFAYGSSSKCTVAQADIAFGVFLFLLFIATSTLSVQQALLHHRGALTGGRYEATGIEAQTKDAWSADTGELDSDHEHHHTDNGESSHPEVHMRSEGIGSAMGRDGHDEDEHALLHSSDPDPLPNPSGPYARPQSWDSHNDEPHPGRPLSWGTERGGDDTGFIKIDTEYHGAEGRKNSSGQVLMPDPEEHRVPSALSPTGEVPSGRVNFPAGNY
ncbi:MAG: hypothetical protein M1820_010325 [Bogoriella megaspora]|nr:MAG: hypothetical protein M1820_010325 [Bogoriella megaspora]